MRKGSDIEVKIDRTEFPSMGIGKSGEAYVQIKNTFPGQVVMARIKKKKAGKVQGKLVEVIERADYETKPKCEHFGTCGGCSSQTIPYQKQLDLLSSEVRQLFVDANRSLGDFEGITGSDNQWEYRNKMEFTFGDMEKGGELTLGMHVRNKSFGIVNVDKCQLVDSDFRKIIDLTVNYFRKTQLSYYRVMKREGYLRHLVIRKAKNTGEIMVNLVTTTQVDFDLSEYVDLLKNTDFEGNLVSVLHTENDSLSDAVIPEKVNVLYGTDSIQESLLGLKFKISPFSFFQTNTKGAEKLYSVVREYLGSSDNKVVFDLYCGTGTIGQIVAPNAQKVIGIELIEEAVEAAKENAKLNGLENCEFLAGDVTEIIKTVSAKPDIIILDPPRSGVHPKAMEYVIKFNAKEIVYVSCNPKTLVDDLEALIYAGYQVKKSRVVDMFPNTPHVEVVVGLQYQGTSKS